MNNNEISQILQRLETHFLPALSPQQIDVEQRLIIEEEKQSLTKIKQFLQTGEIKDKQFKDFIQQDSETKEQETGPDLRCLAFLIAKHQETFNINLKDNQIVALLRLIRSYHHPQERGKILELPTGGGKSSVIAPILLSYLAAKETDPIHIHEINPYLAKRDFEQFLKLAEKLGITDDVGLLENLNDDVNLKKKIVFGYWSHFIHSYQGKFLGQNSPYPQKEPVIVLDEIDQLLSDEATTPAVISKEIKTEKFIRETISEIKEYIKESNTDEEGKEKPSRVSLKLPIREGVEVDFNLDEWIGTMTTTEGEVNLNYLKELMKKMMFYGQEFFSQSKFGLDKKSQEEKIDFFIKHFDFYFFIREVRRKLKEKGDLENFSAEELDSLKEYYDNLPLSKQLIFPYHYPDLQQSLAVALSFKEGEDYFITDEKEPVIKSTSTGYSEKSKRHHSLVELFLRIKHELEWPATVSDIEEERIDVVDFYRHHGKKILGLTGTASPVARLLYQIYGLPTEKIPPIFEQNNKITTIEGVVNFKGNFKEKVERLLSLLENEKNSLVIVENDGQMELLKGKLPDDYEIEYLSANNEYQDAKLYSWVGEKGEKPRLLICVKMAGRGVDFPVSDAIKNEGGLRMILLTPLLSQRDYEQLLGRVGRRGEPGEAILLLSPDDAVFFSLSSSEREEIRKKAEKLKDNPKELTRFLQEKLKRAWEKYEEKRLSDFEGINIFNTAINALRLFIEGKNEIDFAVESQEKEAIRQYLKTHWAGIRWRLENVFKSWGITYQGDIQSAWIKLALEEVRRLYLEEKEKELKS